MVVRCVIFENSPALASLRKITRKRDRKDCLLFIVWCLVMFGFGDEVRSQRATTIIVLLIASGILIKSVNNFLEYLRFTLN